MLKRSYPCNGEATCPGCRGDERKSSRYLANAIDRDDGDRVIPLQMPKDLANRLVVRYERNGTLVDRDFELSRQGENLDTVYDLDAGPVDRMKLDGFQPHDLLRVLEDAYEAVFGPGDLPDGPGEATGGPVRPRQRSKAAQIALPKEDDLEIVEDDDQIDDAPEPEPAPKRRTAKKAAPAEPVFTPEPDDTDAVDEPEVVMVDESDEDDEVAYDEETLKALPFGALRSVARDFGVSTKGKDAPTIIEEILASGEEEVIPY
jgi:hypothetical protein